MGQIVEHLPSKQEALNQALVSLLKKKKDIYNHRPKLYVKHYHHHRRCHGFISSQLNPVLLGQDSHYFHLNHHGLV
jgi:hypothetical protein